MDVTTSPISGGGEPKAAGRSEEVTRALDRLAKARLRVREAQKRLPPPPRGRIEAVERARRAVAQVAAVLERRPDDDQVIKTHALAEIAQQMALRQEGFLTLDDYERAVSPAPVSSEVAAELAAAEQELAAAQADWEQLKGGLGGGSASPSLTLDLRLSDPLVDPRA